uniref:DNA-directed primase/polymerase protein n=1 Tax=Panagrolaimus sp. ES5 TaxID=591445 RepID=A0AC34FLH7_9BILA
MEIEKEVNKQFKVFHKQIDMFDYQKKSLPNGRCFSFEIPNSHMSTGIRKFFVAELDSFWFWYKNVFRESRHFYEIIQEGLPCRLYFDLEFYKADNPDLKEEKALSEFLQFVSSMIKEFYQIDITEKSFLLLDSTTDLKFSVHAIVHFPNNFLFPNNISMKEFIAKLIERMSETGIGIVKKENQETFICDPSVYTKNRNFRIFLSSKFNKNAIFKYRKGCKFYGAAQTSKPISSDSAGIKFHAENFDSGIPPSPLPELDEYVREFNSQYSRNVEIRSWNLLRVYSTKSLRVQYQLNNCKYCLRIQREHVSNNVYWTCHLDREWMYQKCFDYDCRNFISDFFPLPSELMEQIKPKLG